MSAATRHEWQYVYPAGFHQCQRCKALDLGKPTECRGWYYGTDGERVYVEAKS